VFEERDPLHGTDLERLPRQVSGAHLPLHPAAAPRHSASLDGAIRCA